MERLVGVFVRAAGNGSNKYEIRANATATKAIVAGRRFHFHEPVNLKISNRLPISS